VFLLSVAAQFGDVMDPESIAGLTGAIARNAVGFVRGIDDIRAHYRDADLNIENINRQTWVLQFAAERLQRWLDRRGAGLSAAEEGAIRGSVEACGMLIQMLRVEADRTLSMGTERAVEITMWEKVKFLWGQPRLDRYLVGINNQVAVLNHYLQILNMYVSL
jgi:hypothetical protein